MLHSSGMTAMKNSRNVNPERLLSFNRVARNFPATFFAKHPRDIVPRRRAYRFYGAINAPNILLSRNGRGICGKYLGERFSPPTRCSAAVLKRKNWHFSPKCITPRLPPRESTASIIARERKKRKRRIKNTIFPGGGGRGLCARGPVCGKL